MFGSFHPLADKTNKHLPRPFFKAIRKSLYFSDPWGAIHSTKISGNFGPKLNGSVRSNRKSFEKTGPHFEVVLVSRSDRSEFWLNGSRPWFPHGQSLSFLAYSFFQAKEQQIRFGRIDLVKVNCYPANRPDTPGTNNVQ